MGIKFSQLPVIDSVASDDYVPVVDTSASKLTKATVSMLTSGATNSGLPDVYVSTAAATQAKGGTSPNYKLRAGSKFLLRNLNANSYNGKITLNINSTGAKDLWINGAVSSSSNKTLPVGDYDCFYDGTKYLVRTDGKEQVSIATNDYITFGKSGTNYGYYDSSGNFKSFRQPTGTAVASDVLSGKTFSNASDDGLTGTMTNQGAKTATLNAGESYTIPEGYHNGSGKVSANSLASQTAGTATAAQIVASNTAWVNGSKVTGTMTNRGQYTEATSTATDGEGKLFIRIPQGAYVTNSTMGCPEITAPKGNASYNLGYSEGYQAGRNQGRADASVKTYLLWITRNYTSGFDRIGITNVDTDQIVKYGDFGQSGSDSARFTASTSYNKGLYI